MPSDEAVLAGSDCGGYARARDAVMYRAYSGAGEQRCASDSLSNSRGTTSRREHRTARSIARVSRRASATRPADRRATRDPGTQCEDASGTARSSRVAVRSDQSRSASASDPWSRCGDVAAERLHSGARQNHQRRRCHCAPAHWKPASRARVRGHVGAFRRADAATTTPRERERRQAHRSIPRPGDVQQLR